MKNDVNFYITTFESFFPCKESHGEFCGKFDSYVKTLSEVFISWES
jgi:hypothetical protein